MTSALRFLLDLDAALDTAPGVVEVIARAVRLLGIHTGTACGYVEIAGEGSSASIVGDHASAGAGLADQRCFQDLGVFAVRSLHAGEVVALGDSQRCDALTGGERDHYRNRRVRAILAIPLVRQERLAAAMLLRDERARAWRDDDVDLARLVANRCFESIERMRTMREAKEGAAQVRLVADHVPAKISYVDRALHYRFNNAAYGDWYGVDTATIVGRHVRDVLGEATYQERLPYMERALRGETVAFKSRSRHSRLGMRMTDITCVPDVAEDGEVRGFFVMGVDTTERQRAEERLRENDRRKDEFLAMLAHELRNPLAPLSNALYLWPSVAQDAKRADELRALMERQLRQLTRLLDDLLDVSRVSRGRIELRRRPLRLVEALDRALEGARLLADRQQQTLEVLPTPTDLWVSADIERLTQVFGNILNNAVKYTPEGGHIRVAAERDGGYAIVRVVDDGRGIPADMLERVFEMFVQVEPTLENARGGMGIGLALSKRLVEMHGGTIAAISAGAEKGTEVVVRLPLASLEKSATALSETTIVAREIPPDGVAPKHRILVVDDVEASANTLGAALRAMGHDVVVAFDGRSALDAASQFRPDAVFLDLAMPEMNGYDVARHLRGAGAGRDALLVALTGFAQEDDYRRTRDAGFDHHLVKPASMQRIEALLRDHALSPRTAAQQT